MKTFYVMYLDLEGDLCHVRVEAFKERFEDIDIHKDNPTLLYYAENGRKDL